ncbi:MAG: ABC transporter substrate-binding protein [candidate division KSB1 bacterium]|nr:ABC transporter substrate-binding protein [candidate division KSB1 bacterium]MDZ7335589.1 ABC transporter substrate-binding protein [candidate division KSB1 bacterium]MDZ7356461.1 ABC transporter substrate-binding protein [candidate division KSB1 bacterium]MDZ7375339.1 ABC transporter substrate-binding protein [candidate division KSB1 bacterium]MDZ7401232.1 ABC transporter substrate-binding protein [candidate division KSB1 bacterium]
MRILRIIICPLLLLFLSQAMISHSFLMAQTIRVDGARYVPEVEITFSEGVNEYRNQNYPRATDIFESLLYRTPLHQRITATYLMLGKSYYKMGLYKKSVSVLNELIEKYPQSNYLDDAYYTLGFNYYAQADYLNSLKAFLWVADFGKAKKLVEKSRNNALKIIDSNIAFTELQSLKDQITSPIASAIVTIKLSQRYLEQGNRDQAISLLQNFVQKFPDNPYLANVKQLLTKTNLSAPSADVVIGVILPLSGTYSQQARSLLTGMQYVQKKFNDTSQVKIRLVVKDSEGDIVKAVKAAQELARDNQIAAIIGELELEKTVAVAAVLDGFNIPLIVPATSGNGIASINNYIFQLNSDLETRGKQIARYAMQQLGLKTFATLAPADSYGKDMTDSFTATVDQLGGKIVAQKWYYADAQDLSRQFKSIRDLGFQLSNKDSLVRYFSRELDDFRMEKVPVTGIDGVFFPCYTEEIQYLAPQFAYANLRAKIFGGEYWYDLEKLRANQNYVDGIVFCSSYYVDETSVDFIKFRNDFRIVTKRTPEIMELYGCDALSVLAHAIGHRKQNRQEIRDFLDELDKFPGIKGPITFKGNGRVNSEVRILTFKNGRIELLR